MSTLESNPTTIEVPIGGAIIWWSDVLPGPNWGWADGGELSRTEYSYLFSIWGLKHGTPSSGTVFKKPDMRDKFPKGASDTAPVGTISSGGAGLSLTPASDHTHGAGSYSASVALNGTAASAAGITVGSPGSAAVSGASGAGGAHTHSISGSVDPPSVSVNYAIRLR